MFFENMATAAQQVVILYLMVAVGFAADRFGIFKQTAAKMSNDLLFYIITPVVIVQSFLSMKFCVDTAEALLKAFLCMCGTITVGILLALPFFRKTGANEAIYKYGVSYGNMGYMALPLCQAILGNEGVFYCSAGVAAFNIISFTHGVWLMTKDDASFGGFKARKLILNPGVISVLIGLPLYLLGAKLPMILNSAVGNIAALNTPLAMIFLGTYIANTDLKTLLREKENYLVAFLKLIVLPLVMLGIFRLCGVTGTLLCACIISASAPCANNTVMFSAKYGKDTGLASKTVTLCSLLSIFTIPVMIALSRV